MRVLVVGPVRVVGDVHQQDDRRDQVQHEGHRVVKQFVRGLGDDSTGAERYQAGRQQTERPDEEGNGHQQEEHLRVGGVVRAEVPRHEANVDGADYLGRCRRFCFGRN